jgi:hypothetical protein
MNVTLGPVTLHGSVSAGHWGFLAFGWWGSLKSPRFDPLFSERYGHEVYRQLGGGWRWKIRRVRKWSQE